MKRFQNVASRCGESSEYPANNPGGLSGARNCNCTGASTQNTHQILLQIFGAGSDEPPVVSFTEPQNGATVQSGFRITVVATDDISMDRVEIWIDGALWKTATTSPYIFLTDPLAGAHSIIARGIDKSNHITDVNISVTVNPPCTSNDECASGEICDDGQCIPGPGTPGGLGSPCTDSSACASGICAGGPDGMRCVEVCTPGGTDCPDGFDCLGAGGGGACWPTQETLDPGGDGSGGCVIGGGQRDSSLIGAALAMLGAALLFGRRRR
jgi:MYXO-CTERM domain-containing protein